MALSELASYTLNRRRREQQEREEKQKEKEKKRKRLEQYKKDLKYYTIDTLEQHFENYGTKIYPILCENEQKGKVKRQIVECLTCYKDIKNIEQMNVDIDLIYFETLNKLLTRYKKMEKEQKALEEEQEELEEQRQEKKQQDFSFVSVIIAIFQIVIKAILFIFGMILFFIFGIFGLAGKM